MLDQQSKCISIACDSLWTSTTLADQMISKEGLHQRRDQPCVAHESPPGSQERRKVSPAAVSHAPGATSQKHDGVFAAKAQRVQHTEFVRPGEDPVELGR